MIKRNLTRLKIHTDFVENCYDNAVGVASPNIIADSHMTASSQHKFSKPTYGRLHSNRGDGWCSKEATSNDDWLQLDLNRTIDVCAVATQGDSNGNEWVTDFKLSYSSDASTWTTYLDGNGTEMVRAFVIWKNAREEKEHSDWFLDLSKFCHRDR